MGASFGLGTSCRLARLLVRGGFLLRGSHFLGARASDSFGCLLLRSTTRSSRSTTSSTSSTSPLFTRNRIRSVVRIGPRAVWVAIPRRRAREPGMGSAIGPVLFGNLGAPLVHFGVVDGRFDRGEAFDVVQGSPEVIRGACGFHGRDKDQDATGAMVAVHKVHGEHLVDVGPVSGQPKAEPGRDGLDGNVAVVLSVRIAVIGIGIDFRVGFGFGFRVGVVVLSVLVARDVDVLHFIVALVDALDKGIEDGRFVESGFHHLVEVGHQLIGDELTAGSSRVGGIGHV